jgi:hypothetical protein
VKKITVQCIPTGRFLRGAGVYSFEAGDGAGHVYPEVRYVVRAVSYAKACDVAKRKYGGYPTLYVTKMRKLGTRHQRTR